MSKIVQRDRVVIFLESIKPLEGSIMRTICDSHEVLRNKREELRMQLKLAFYHIRSVANNMEPAQSPADLIKQLEAAIEADEALDEKQIW